MSGLLRSIVRLGVPVLRQHTMIQRANLQTKPAKEKIGAVETVIGISMFSVAVLGPSGWVLAHLEDYKKKE